MIWNIIDWKSIALRINRLQLKIYKASLEKNIASVRKYQRTLLKSHEAKLLAVRKITQDNRKKRTAGIDGISRVNDKERIILANELKLD